MNRDRLESSVVNSAKSSSSNSDSERRTRLLPELSCDCHIHILGPETQYEFSTDRQYTPMIALVPEAMHMLKGLGCTRAVIVQPSVYGPDNSCTLDAMDRFPISTRCIVVIPTDISPSKLKALHDKGARGFRLNGIHWSSDEFEKRFSEHQNLFDLMKELKWHVECYVGPQTHSVLPRIAESNNLDFVLDHYGGPFRKNESIDDRISALDKLFNTGRIWIKISGFYRLESGKKGLNQFKPLIEFLVLNHSDRLLWGSDWPHTPDTKERQKSRNTRLPFQKIDTYKSLALLLQYVRDQNIVDKIFIKNPEIIYQF